MHKNCYGARGDFRVVEAHCISVASDWAYGIIAAPVCHLSVPTTAEGACPSCPSLGVVETEPKGYHREGQEDQPDAGGELSRI